MYRIDDSLKEFVESGVATIVGTGDPAGLPEVIFGWGPRVCADGHSIEVFIDTERAGRTLANLEGSGRIAVTMADPVSCRSVQFKGTVRETGDPAGDDDAWVQQQREAFVVSTTLVGDSPAVIRNLWLNDVVRMAFDVEAAFDQTPGPDAGRPL